MNRQEHRNCYGRNFSGRKKKVVGTHRTRLEKMRNSPIGEYDWQ